MYACVYCRRRRRHRQSRTIAVAHETTSPYYDVNELSESTETYGPQLRSFYLTMDAGNRRDTAIQTDVEAIYLGVCDYDQIPADTNENYQNLAPVCNGGVITPGNSDHGNSGPNYQNVQEASTSTVDESRVWDMCEFEDNQVLVWFSV